MTYSSPRDTQAIDPEMEAMNKTEDLEEEKFEFSTFFVLGLVLILIGFFRMFFLNQLSLLNAGFVALGFVISLSSQTWMRRKALTLQEQDLIKHRIEIQYEIADGDSGFTDTDIRNEKRLDYLSTIEKQGISPDVKHKEKYVNANEVASFNPEEHDDTNNSR